MCYPPLKLLYSLMPGRMDPASDLYTYDMTVVVGIPTNVGVGVEPTPPAVRWYSTYLELTDVEFLVSPRNQKKR